MARAGLPHLTRNDGKRRDYPSDAEIFQILPRSYSALGRASDKKSYTARIR